MQSQVEDVKAKLNIVDIVGEYVRLQKAGGRWKANCPFHHEKTPSFFVNDERQTWHCFGCAKGGDVISFVMEIEGMEFREALRMLAERAGVQLAHFDPAVARERNAVKEILELSTKFYEKQLWDGAGKGKVLGYLRERGLAGSAIKQFRLGYAPDGWRHLLEFLTSRGYSTQDIEKGGMIIRKNPDQLQATSYKLQVNFYDRFRDRIMFPVADAMGAVIGFSARVSPGGDQKQAKYINTPETALYTKGRVLYGIDQAKRAIKDANTAVIVEGNMDVIACHQAGIGNTVAVSGTAMTADHLAVLKRYASRIKLFFDMDSAGKDAAKKSALLCLRQDLNPEMVRVSGGKDAADIARDDPEALKGAIQQSIPAMDYFFEEILAKFDRRTAEGKKMIARELVAVIATLSDPVEAQHWIKTLAHDVEVDDRVISAAVARSRNDQTNHSASQLAQDRQTDDFPVDDRTQTLREKIAAIALLQESVWQELSAADHAAVSLLRSRGDLLSFIVEQGEAAEYKLGALYGIIRSTPVEPQLNRALAMLRKRLGPAAEELTLADAREMIRECLEELQREADRSKVRRLEQDIQKAETEKDQSGLRALMDEFMRLNRKLKQ